MIQLNDVFAIDDAAKIHRTSDGYLVATPRVARTGIQLYRGSEVGKPNIPVVRVMRPESEVFKDSAMASLAYKPITDDHPSAHLDAKNWTRHARGFVGAEVVRDGSFIRVPMMISDENLISKIQNGKAQLSVGYACNLKWEPGEFNGEKYDAIQTDIKANHIAVVDAARGGSHLTLGDQTMNQEILSRPGQVQVSDAERGRREALYADHERRLTEAWKSPPPVARTNDRAPAPNVGSGDVYEKRDQRLRDAWRGGA